MFKGLNAYNIIEMILRKKTFNKITVDIVIANVTALLDNIIHIVYRLFQKRKSQRISAKVMLSSWQFLGNRKSLLLIVCIFILFCP